MYPLRTHLGGLGLALLIAASFLSQACTVSDSAVYAAKDDSADADVLAVVDGTEITEEEVAGAAAGELLRVNRERHEILEKSLDGLIRTRLLELEAEARGMSIEELMAEAVESKVEPPSQEAIDAFYEARKGQIRQPKEAVEERIGQFLTQEQQQTVLAEFIAELKTKYGFESYLEPLRVAVEDAGFPSRGPENAPVTIIEFSDFECPYCSRVVPTLEQIVEAYGDRVRLVFRQFPLNNIHPNAQKAAEASLCANDQGKFWEMHDLMFKEQKSLELEQLKEKAARLELDVEAFNECLDSSKYAEAVMNDQESGSQIGVSGTPALFINGRFLSGAQPYEQLAAVIDEELAKWEPKTDS
jgi:protein-disulfide isomerase